MNTPNTPPAYPVTFGLKADGWGGDVTVDVRAIRGKTATVSISSGEQFWYSFERRHWDRLRSSFLAIRMLQKMRESGASVPEIETAAGTSGVDLRLPDDRMPQWLLKIFDYEERWASLKVPCCEGAMYIGLCHDCRAVTLSRSWRGTVLEGPRFSALKLTALIEHVAFAAEHAKTIIETR